jgi:phenylalanyl-tRNA synthetase alpha chain
MITYETHEVISHVLTLEGVQIANEGSHEARVWSALPEKGKGTPVSPVQLKKLVGDETAKVGQGRAFKNGWIGKDGDGLVKLVCSQSRAGNSCILHGLFVSRLEKLQTRPETTC